MELQSTEMIVPLHPRTRKIITGNKIQTDFTITQPVGYLEMVYLLKKCSMVMTDSGGLQKEAFFFNKPCITLRDETEWIELVNNNYNIIAGADKLKIINSWQLMLNADLDFSTRLYGDGTASRQIIKELIN